MLEIKKQVIKYAKKLNNENLSPLRSGNISMRGINDGVEGFFITPSGIKYEDLVKNPEDEFRKILNYLAPINNFSFNEKKFQNSLRSIDFNNLKELETRKGFDERTGKNEIFFRKGIIDEWKTTLNGDILDLVQNKFNTEMEELNYI